MRPEYPCDSRMGTVGTRRSPVRCGAIWRGRFLRFLGTVRGSLSGPGRACDVAGDIRRIPWQRGQPCAPSHWWLRFAFRPRWRSSPTCRSPGDQFLIEPAEIPLAFNEEVFDDFVHNNSALLETVSSPWSTAAHVSALGVSPGRGETWEPGLADSGRPKFASPESVFPTCASQAISVRNDPLRFFVRAFLPGDQELRQPPP